MGLFSTNKKEKINPKHLVSNAVSEIINRMNIARQTGIQYGGKRDIYKALGYDETVTFQMYLDRYKRQDIAAAVIDRPANTSWKGELKVTSEQSESFEKEFSVLARNLKLKQYFKRLDKMMSLGEYAVMVIGTSDLATRADYEQPIQSSNLDINYIKVLNQSQAEIVEYETNTKDPRYGLPKLYNIKLDTDTSIRVHWSRCIHCVGQSIDSEVFGVPVLENIYNRLQDLEKSVGGSSEMFWRNGRPGISYETKDGVELNQDAVDAMEAQADEYDHGFRRILAADGATLKALTQQQADPKNTVDVAIQMISAATGIPKRMLLGSEQSQLASSQDTDNYLDMIQERRESICEPQIVRSFISFCVKIGMLQDVEYNVLWSDLFTKSDEQKATIAKTRMEALKIYAESLTVENYLTFEAFLKNIMQLEPAVIDDILTSLSGELNEGQDV